MSRRKQAGKSKATVAAFQAAFVEAYIALGENATRAYLTVRPDVKETTGAVEGHRLLKIPKVQQAIEKRRAAIRARFALTTDRVMQELARVAYFNPQALTDEHGKTKQLHELSEDAAAALSLVIDGKGNILQVRTPTPAAKNTAVEKAVKILRLYDKPPPPPPVDETGEQEDEREIARRAAFMLAREKHLKEKA